jgi:hypothetical protein
MTVNHRDTEDTATHGGVFMKRLLRGALIVAFVLGVTLAARAGDPLITMLDPYFRIQSALSDDKTDGVKADATTIATTARTLGAAGTEIVQAADALAGTADLVAARTAFGKLSDAVIAYSERTKTAAGDGVTAMVCPMTKKQWLQKGEKIANPYFGKSMLTCGEKKKKKTA